MGFVPPILWRHSFPAILSRIWGFSAGGRPSQSLQLVQTLSAGRWLCSPHCIKQTWGASSFILSVSTADLHIGSIHNALLYSLGILLVLMISILVLPPAGLKFGSLLLRSLLSFLQLQLELWYIPFFSLENLTGSLLLSSRSWVGALLLQLLVYLDLSSPPTERLNPKETH